MNRHVAASTLVRRGLVFPGPESIGIEPPKGGDLVIVERAGQSDRLCDPGRPAHPSEKVVHAHALEDLGDVGLAKCAVESEHRVRRDDGARSPGWKSDALPEVRAVATPRGCTESH